MSTGKKLLNHIYGKRCTLVLSILFVFVLFAVFAYNSTNGSSALSQRYMENIFGGFDDCHNCDDCTGMSDTMIECFYTGTPIECTDIGCIWKSLNTASCRPNKGETADGCDTAEVSPPATSIRQYDFFVDMHQWCPVPVNEENWKDIFYGCDTCHQYACTRTYADTVACELLGWTGCPGVVCTTTDRGTKYECGCE